MSRSWIYGALLKAVLMAAAINRRTAFERIPALVHPAKVSSWWQPYPHYYVMVVSNWKEGNVRTSIGGGSHLSSMLPRCTFTVIPFAPSPAIRCASISWNSMLSILYFAGWYNLLQPFHIQQPMQVYESLLCKQKCSDGASFAWIVNISQVLWGSGLPIAHSFLRGTLLNDGSTCIKMAGSGCKLG